MSSPFSSPFPPSSPSLHGHQGRRLEVVAQLMVEVQELCNAVRAVEPAHPERVRADIVIRFNDLRPMIRDIEDQALSLEGNISDEISALIIAYRRVERLVDTALAALDDLVRGAGFEALERRLSADDTQDRLERDMPYSRVRRSYDGWRRRP